MVKKYRIVIYLFLVICVGLLLYIFCKPDIIQWATISEDDRAVLVTGDIIFTEGESLKSSVVKISDGENDTKFSHCGFILCEGDDVYVVHMSIDKDMIVKEPIDDFLVINSVLDFAVCRVQQEYDSNIISEALGKLLKRGVLFDNSFNNDDESELYCTELICNVYKRYCDIDLFPLECEGRIIYPNNLFNIFKLKQIF